MKKTPEMRRRETKRKKRLEWEKLFREFHDGFAITAVHACKAGQKLKAMVEAIKKANQQLTRMHKQV